MGRSLLTGKGNPVSKPIRADGFSALPQECHQRQQTCRFFNHPQPSGGRAFAVTALQNADKGQASGDHKKKSLCQRLKQADGRRTGDVRPIAIRYENAYTLLITSRNFISPKICHLTIYCVSAKYLRNKATRPATLGVMERGRKTHRPLNRSFAMLGPADLEEFFRLRDQQRQRIS